MVMSYMSTRTDGASGIGALIRRKTWCYPVLGECVARGRKPTAADVEALAERIWRDASGAGGMRWIELDPAGTDRWRMRRAARSALGIDGGDEGGATPATALPSRLSLPTWKGNIMQIDTTNEAEQMTRRLDQILRELRIHNEREERREAEAEAAEVAARTRFVGL
jgi:hypothetical protein